MTVRVETRGAVRIVTIDRPERRNAVDPATASALYEVFRAFDAEADAHVAVLTGAGGAFCAGADLKALSQREASRLPEGGDAGPMGPTWMGLGKPVIAAIEGPAVAGGLELACWCDLRVAGRSAVLGVFNRRFGVPLVDGGTIRLPRLIGYGRAMDLILTGRAVGAEEALAIGLVNRVVEDGQALEAAIGLAETLAGFPQTAMRHDRMAAVLNAGLDWEAALANEIRLGQAVLDSGESRAGAAVFAGGAGRHGGPA